MFGVKRLLVYLDLMYLLQLHFTVNFGASAMTFGKIFKAFRLTCAREICHNIQFSASYRDACQVISSASRQLSSMSVNSVDS